MKRFTSSEAPPPVGWYWVISKRFVPVPGYVHVSAPQDEYDSPYAFVLVGDSDTFEWGEGEEFVLIGPLVPPPDEFGLEE